MLRLKGRHYLRLSHCGKLEHKALVIQIEFKIYQIPRVRNHITIIIVLKISDAVEIHPGCPAVAEQPFLIIHLMLMENAQSLVCIDIRLFNRKFLCHIFLLSLIHI